MAVTIDGNLGVTSPDFEPSSSTTPTNGLFLPTTNALGFATNSTERLRLDASGNLGLGVTPSGWATNGTKALQFPGGAFAGYTNGTTNNQALMYCNAYNNGTNTIYINSDYATQYRQYSGTHAWFISASGTAGNAISFTQAMTLDASGNLGIRPSGATIENFNIYGPSGVNTKGAFINLYSNEADYAKPRAQVAVCGSAYDNPYQGFQPNHFVLYSAYSDVVLNADTGNAIKFYCNTERARIDSSGNLLVGNTNNNGAAKINAQTASSSYTAATFGSNYAGDVSNAALLVWKTDNNTTTSQVFQRFAINNNGLSSGQINANGTQQVAFGAWSDRRLKENITALPNQLANICALKPSEFDYKDGSGHQIGFIAQEMQEVYPDVVGEGEDGMLTITGWSKTEARLVKAIQELTTRLEALENK